MLWLDGNGYIYLSYIRRDEQTGRVRASGGIRDKQPDGNYVFKNVDVRFTNKCADRALKLVAHSRVKITSGGVDFYSSSIYKTAKGNPVTMACIVINDFQLMERTESSNAANTRPQSVATPKADKLPWAEESEDPFGT